MMALASGVLAVTLSCDPGVIDPRSWALTTRAQALNVTADRYDWLDGFALGKHELALADLNERATRLAERAREIDPRNLMASSILARQMLIEGDAERAEEAMRAVMDAGGAVVWTATLYDVDARTYFALAFDKSALRVFRFDQLVGSVDRGFYGIPKFPGPENERFWRSVAGCLDPSVAAEATVPWSEVREIKAGNWVLWFKLTRPITVSSDRTNKKKELREIKVNLHGRTGTLEVYKPVGSDQLAMRGRGPAGYQGLVRRTLVKFVDPEKRIALPPLKPGVGW
jgi:hypothetical protein